MDVLIVDDEMYAVKALVSNLAWTELGFSGVYEAYSVSEAKRIIESKEVKVLISDIEMPGASGIDLLEWVRSTHPEIETVFLTCHSDFQYVRQGLHYGLAQYLLKPVDYAELYQVIRKLVEKLTLDLETKRYNEAYKKYYRLWEEQKPVLVERFWQNLVEERFFPSAEETQELMSAYDIPLQPGNQVLPLLIGVEEWYKELSGKDEEIMNYALRNAAEEMLLTDRNGIVFRDRHRNTLVLFYGSEHPFEALEERCRSFIEACDHYLFCSLSCYIGRPTTLTALPYLYLTLMRAFRSNVTQSRACLRVQEEPFEDFGKNTPPPIDSWRVLLETGKSEELLQRVEHYISGLGAEKRLSAETLHAIYHSVVNMIYHLFHKLGLSVHNSFEWQQGLDLPQATRTLAQFRVWVNRVIPEAVRAVRNHGGDHSAVIEKVKQFVADNVDKEFMREDIAAYVYLNSDYVSRMFRKETGQSLQDYIIQQKIAHARSLLISTNTKISDVGYKVGYSNIPYFTSLFKRVVGLSPQEFRKKYQV